MKGLFLDDERNPQEVTWVSYQENIEWTVVRSFSEFVKAAQLFFTLKTLRVIT